MTRKKERPSRFGGMGSVLTQHRVLDTALGPGEGDVDAAADQPVRGAGQGPAPSEPAAPPPPPTPRAAAPAAAPAPEPAAATAPPRAAPDGPAAARIGMRPVDEIRRSPFQPHGRPSAGAVLAVRRAIAEAGSLDALVNTEGARVFHALDAEAARLAELAFDIATNGVKDPIVTRTTDEGDEECLSGHRRLAAATLAGLADVPVLSRGPMSNANAAATVLSGNLHREAFTTWQEAVLVTEVRERREAERLAHDVRSLGKVMGWATGKAQARLKLRRMLSDALLERLGDASLVERVGHLRTEQLNRIANTPDEARRLAVLRRALGVGEPGARSAGPDGQVIVQRPRRGGGFVLEVRAEVEEMAPSDLAELRGKLEAQLARVMTRIGGKGAGAR